MTDLRQALDDYLRLRRSLGHQMAEAAYLLPDFVGFMGHRGEQTLTVAAALDWMRTREPEVITTVSPRRITAVRGFARYLSGIDPATEVPPMGLVPYNRRRGQVFLYSDADIAAIMAATKETIPQPLRAATYRTLIGLLAASGLRIGEAIKLDRDDIDWTEGVLHIRESKFGKSRLVPLQDSVTSALREYDRLREDLMPRPKDPAFFISLTAKRLIYACVHPVFRALVDTAGVGLDAPHRPRLHELRHTLAVRTLLHWYRTEDNIQAKIPSLSTYMGHREPACTYWYLSAAPELLTLAAARRDGVRKGSPPMTLIAPTLQTFFTDRLARQRQASPRTIAAYRDALRLLLGFVQQRTGTAPAKLDWNDLNADVISAFLNHLEDERGNSTRTRNVRLTAIRSLFSYAALQHPEHALLIQRVLDIPPKRFDKRTMTFLTSDEVDALLAAPDPKRWEGRRDKAMLALAVQTGLRVTELTSLNCDDITIGDGAAVRCEGKGRKQRTVPLDRPVQHLLRSWLNERAGHRGDPLFCTRNGRRLSRDAVAQRLSTHTATAATTRPSLLEKSIHPHVLRHSCAMALLQAGVDTTVIALWLGHAGVRSTDAYLHADMTIKEKALALTTPATARPGRYRPTDSTLAFLDSL